jgi:predicted small metal-binding protein
MAKYIRCKDVGVDCDFEARADTMDELMMKCAAHAKSAHNMTEIPDDLKEKVVAAIRDIS